MLTIKYKIKRDPQGNNIKFPISNNIDYITDEYRFNPFIEKNINQNINKITDGDTSIFKPTNIEKLYFYFGESQNNTVNYFFDNFISNKARKSFFLLEFFDNFKRTSRNKLFETYFIGVPETNFIYDIINIEVPNNINKEIIYGRFSFFNSNNGKMYQLSHNTSINDELDVLFEINLNLENKNFELTKTNFYEIISEIYNTKEQSTVDASPNKKPQFPDGSNFVINQDNIEFTD